MTGVLAPDEARQLRAALEGVTDSAVRDAFLRLLAVLEESPAAVVLPADELLSTQAVAEHLGVSRMTVVRLIDQGRLEAAGARNVEELEAKTGEPVAR